MILGIGFWFLYVLYINEDIFGYTENRIINSVCKLYYNKEKLLIFSVII